MFCSGGGDISTIHTLSEVFQMSYLLFAVLQKCSIVYETTIENLYCFSDILFRFLNCLMCEQAPLKIPNEIPSMTGK